MSGELYTFQDFEQAKSVPDFLWSAIERHQGSKQYKMAIEADAYDRQENTTINNYVKTIYKLTGEEVVDFTAANSRIASNYFHRLNTQRCMYSLGKGVSFIDAKETGADTTKEALGVHFDHDIQDAAYKALIHGVSFCFWNLDRLYTFPLTEFVPFWDEHDGTLKAGARFWRLSPDHPMIVVLYELDGYTKYATDTGGATKLAEIQEKRGYIETIATTAADATEEIVGVENYSSLPIVPLWGSKLKQSTLVGLQQSIDSYDLIRSGFANDLSDVAQIYWIIENAGGMTESDLAQFRDRLLFNHIAQADTSGGSKITPYAQEIPFQARQAYLEAIRSEIYESFGALDVHTIAAGSTNDHIDAAYQPLDEEASDFEFQLSECIRQILALQGIDDSPIFRRNRVSNQMEQTQMVIMEAQWLDRETVLRKLPNITPEEVEAIIERVDGEDYQRMTMTAKTEVTEDGTAEAQTTETETPDESKAPETQMLNGAQATAVVTITQRTQEGVISKEQAIFLVAKVLGITEEEARKFVEQGNDKPLPETETPEEQE